MCQLTKVFITVIAVILLFYLLYPRVQSLTEGFDCESCQTLSSLYNKKEITSDNLRITKNAEISGDLTVKGAINGNPKVKDQLEIGNWTIYQDKDGKLQFKNSKQSLPMMSLPSKTEDAPVFRGTGIIYNNYAFADDSDWTVSQPLVTQKLFKEQAGAVYLGGASQNPSDRIMLALLRGAPDNNVVTVDLHGNYSRTVISK